MSKPKSLPRPFLATPGPERIGRVWLNCHTCKTWFDRKNSEHKRDLERGKQHAYCSQTCSEANPLRSAPANTVGRALKDVELRRALAETYKHARSNAAKKEKVPFELTPEELDSILERSGGCCEISKLPFIETATNKRFERRPFMPSIDRIDSTKGYTAENCRLVLSSLNIMMNGWGQEVTEKVMLAVVEQMILRGDPAALALLSKFSPALAA